MIHSIFQERFGRIGRYYRQQRLKGFSTWESITMLSLKVYTKVTKSKRPSGSVITGFQFYNKPLLVSYSRSGTNWIRYIVEYLSRKSYVYLWCIGKGEERAYPAG